MRDFNLVDEPWIPVRRRDGTRERLGIRDVLIQAKQIAGIEDPSPLVVGALYRLLLAVLYRAIDGPSDIDEARALFAGGLPADKIAEYLKQWHDRFWLFDDKHPFFQVPDFEPKEKKGKKEWRSWTPLACQVNADNQKVLFDHVDTRNAGAIPKGTAACYLVACQTFALSSGKSDLAHTKTAPSATSVMAMPMGQHLEDTLLLALVPQNRLIFAHDRPIWEKGSEPVSAMAKGPTRPATGLANLYSWQTRSVRLNPEQIGDAVSELVFASGVAVGQDSFDDPMVGYRIHDKLGPLPIQFRQRGFWRDFDSLLPDAEGLAPKVVSHAQELTRKHTDRFPRSVLVLGQANTQAKVDFWRLERFSLPLALAGDRFIRQEVRQLLDDAEEARKALWSASRTFARHVLSRGDRDPDKADMQAFVNQLALEESYLSALEAEFHKTLDEFTLDSDSDEIRSKWLKSVRNNLRSVWQEHSASVGVQDAWTIRALHKSEGPVSRKLSELNDIIADLDS